MLTVLFEDHKDRIKEILRKKLGEATFAAADKLADSYKDGLQETIAPPHSRLGQIPHAYMGWKPGGYGPTNPNFRFDDQNTWVNNVPPEFDSAQVSYLSNFIESGSGEEKGVVGFRPSHVTDRSDNYLLSHDQFWGRPWVRPIYEQVKDQMAAVAKQAFEKD